MHNGPQFRRKKISIIIVSFDGRLFDLKDNLISREKKVPFSMATGNDKLMHGCFPKQVRMGTARILFSTFVFILISSAKVIS